MTTSANHEYGEVMLYKGFKLIYLHDNTLAAYRGEVYVQHGIASYAVNVKMEYGDGFFEALGDITNLIDRINDSGNFAMDEPLHE